MTSIIDTMKKSTPVFDLPFLFVCLFTCLLALSTAYAEEVEIKHGDITLNANLELADGKTIKDGIILLTHGTLAHSKHSIMQQLQELFTENELNSLAINLGLGIDKRHGMYDCSATHTHKHTDALDEISAWLDWLKEKGASNVSLLGHSRGGNQTAWFAAERDDPVIKHIILVAPQIWNEKSASEKYKQKYGKELKPILAKAQALLQAGKPRQIMKGIDFIYCKDANVSAASFASYYTPEPRMDTPSLLSKIKKPVLIFSGTEDTVVKDLDKIYAALPDKGNSELAIIDGAGHMFLDLYTEEMVDKIVEFLGK